MSLRFVSAGHQSNQHSNAGIYVKYGNYGRFEIVSESPYYVHMITPDRELYIQSNTLRECDNPLVRNFDEYVDLNIMGKRYPDNFIGQYMINFVDSGDETQILKRKKNSGSTIFCDSGGFQIAMGRCTIINPIDLVKFYNENVNLGMVLDIPDYNGDKHFPDEMIMELAKIQKRNNEYMLKYKADDVELINILHGSKFNQRIEYLKAVHDDRIQRLAIPSVGIPMTLPRLNLFLEVLRTAKLLGHYKHLHVLGSFNKGVIHVLAKMAHSSLPECQGIEFTMDASSPLQNSVNFTYCKNLSIWDGLQEYAPLPKEKYTQINHIQSMYAGGLGKFNPYSLLPCSCPVCSKLKYSYVLRNIKGGTLRNMMFLNHNAIEANSYVNMVDFFAETLSNKEYIEHIQKLQDSGDNDTILCLKFLNHAEKVGLDQARKDFNAYLQEKPGVVQTTGLMSQITGMKKEEGGLNKHIQNLIKEYNSIDFENYHEKLKIGKSVRSATNLKGEDYND